MDQLRDGGSAFVAIIRGVGVGGQTGMEVNFLREFRALSGEDPSSSDVDGER